MHRPNNIVFLVSLLQSEICNNLSTRTLFGMMAQSYSVTLGHCYHGYTYGCVICRVSHELQKEAKMFTLHHINIVALHAVILELGHYGFVMEYVLHGSLDDFMFTYYVWCSVSGLYICSWQWEQLSASVLSVCLSVAKKMLFSQKLSNLELWSLLTTYRKSYMGFSKNP